MNPCQLAFQYLESGLFVLPIKIDGSKQTSAPTWSFHSKRLPTHEEVQQWFCQEQGIAIVGGPCSGNLEILDFENEHVFDQWKSIVEATSPGLVATLVITKTPGSKYFDEDKNPITGRHVLYRVAAGTIPKSQSLAKDQSGNLLVETKGKGGYVIVPGGPVGVHPSGRPYELLQGSITKIAVISPENRKILITSAQLLNQFVNPRKDCNPVLKRSPSGDRPGDQFNLRGDWSFLTDHGWQLISQNTQTKHWRRPGKMQGCCSATTGYCKGQDGTDRLYVFSTNATPFEAGHTYSPFAAFTLLNCEGDFSAAATALRQFGCGQASNASCSQGQLDSDSELRLTDIGNAQKMVELHGNDFRYVHAWSKFIHWDQTRWQTDDSGQIERFAKNVVKNLYSSAGNKCSEAAKDLHASTPDQSAERFLAQATSYRKHAKRSASVQRIKAMIALTSSEPGIAITPSELDSNALVLNCLNGVIDLRTGQLHKHRREDFLTKVCSVNYDPQAACPRFQAFLLQVMNNQTEMVSYLQRAIGYSITADPSEHTVFINHGRGANGKTVFMNVMLNVLGDDYGMQGHSDLLLASRSERHPTEQADLFGKRFISISEVDEGRHLAEARLKYLTGGDKIRARRMREDFWQFDPTHKFWLATNHKPHVRGQDEGMWRRIQLIPWTVTIPLAERNQHLLSQLLEEKPGILNWAIKGCHAWQQQGLSPPEQVIRATRDYRSEQDSLQMFIDENCSLGADCRVSSSLLYSRFVEHTPQNKSISITDFVQAMENKGFFKKRSAANGGYQWHGLALSGQSSDGGEYE